MQPAVRDQQSADTMDELRALNARFIHNFVTNDVASHDAIQPSSRSCPQASDGIVRPI
jgi:hypothetical protein